jgi:uncharacterized protein YndB with AHSA1/START domain
MTILRPAIVALAAGLVVSPALALEVTESVEISAPPEKVWQTISGFCSIADWHPMIAKCVEGEKNGAALRTLTTTDGAVLVERRVQYSDEGMSYSYQIVESPLPVANYEATLAVLDGPEGSMVTWSGEFSAKGTTDATALETIDDIYGAGLRALKERLR